PIDLSYDPAKYIVTVHGFRGSKVAFLSPYVILKTFCTGKPTASTSPQACPPLPTSWDMPVLYMTGEAGGSGTWYLAIMWQNQHVLRGLRVLNFVLVPNVESRFQRETLNL
ncbi:MAG: hypothetical protein ABIJ44_06240, partial [Pseudomonadota bacterium]